MRGRLRCPRCIVESLRTLAPKVRRAGLRNTFRSVRHAIVSEHPVRHSGLLGTCLDVGVIEVVEAVNVAICPTRFSCQGDPGEPGWAHWPMISVADAHWPAMLAWLDDNGVGWSGHTVGSDGTLTPPVDGSTETVMTWRSRRGHVHLYFRDRGPADVFAPIMRRT